MKHNICIYNRAFEYVYRFVIKKNTNEVLLPYKQSFFVYEWYSAIYIEDKHENLIGVFNEGDTIKMYGDVFTLIYCYYEYCNELKTNIYKIVIQNNNDPIDVIEYLLEDFILLFNQIETSYIPYKN